MIKYIDGAGTVVPEQLEGFFDGWPNPPEPATHLLLLQQSGEAIVAVDETTGRVVGFITALTDGVLSAYIPLLEVLPAYRSRGIGSELLKRMFGKLGHLYMIDLLCDPDKQAFYGPLGFQPASGMMIRNYTRQAGTAHKP